MRLNQKTFPILDFIDGKQPAFDIPLDNMLCDSFEKPIDLINFTKGLEGVFAQITNRYMLTQPFIAAVLKAMPKITEEYRWINPKPDCGMMVTDGGFCVYLMSPKDEKIKMMAIGGTNDCVTCYGIVTHDNDVYGSYVTKAGHDKVKLCMWVDSIMLTHYFINNCEVEEKVIEQGQKARIAKGRQFNETKNPYIILDCSWFTQLVHVNATSVQGHYRWQPHGRRDDGKKKLIYIEGFDKQPYTRKAKKEVHNGK